MLHPGGLKYSEENSTRSVKPAFAKVYLRFDRGAINLIPPTFSSPSVGAATICSSRSRFSDTGDTGTSSLTGLVRFRLAVIEAGVDGIDLFPVVVLIGGVIVELEFTAIVEAGFLSVFRDGGGGMSSTRP